MCGRSRGIGVKYFRTNELEYGFKALKKDDFVGCRNIQLLSLKSSHLVIN